MEDPYEQEITTEESALINPPAYADDDPKPTAIQPPSVHGQPAPLAAQSSAAPVPQMGQYPQVQVGGVLPQTWPQGYPMPQAVGHMPTMVVSQPPPNCDAPHDFFMLSLVTTIICGILNLLSLSFGIPAIVFSALSIHAKNSKDYPQARQHGRNALILTVINIIFTLCLTLLIIGLTVGFVCANPNVDYYYSYSYYNYDRCYY